VPLHEITAPDGSIYDVDAPYDTPDHELLAAAEAHHNSLPVPATMGSQSGNLSDTVFKPIVNWLGGVKERIEHPMETIVNEANRWKKMSPIEMASNVLPVGATAWHGSPHLFDKFANEAIGTGEGTNDIIHNKLNISEARNDNPIRPEQPIDGKIKTDYEGRTIGAEYVVGRRYEDTPQSPLTYNEAMDAATKIGAISSEAQNLGRSLGKFIKSSDANGNTTRNIILKTGLGDKSGDVYSHEFSHLLDDIAFGGVETAGAKKEFADVYSELNKPYRGGKPFTAKDAGYKGADIEKEHIAEAIRFYLQNPEAMKEMAPNAARKIRDAFNSNPNINKIVQFNSVAGAVGLGAIGGQENNPDDIRILERNGQPTGAKPWKEDK